MGRVKKNEGKDVINVAFCGNPNVGKSTLFNTVTGSSEHTGNWSGKTVGVASHRVLGERAVYDIYDIPGIYSLVPRSEEERIARDFLYSGKVDVCVYICDAGVLGRSLPLLLQIKETGIKIVVVLNLVGEGRRHGIFVDAERLSAELDSLVVELDARRGKAKKALLSLLDGLDPVDRVLPRVAEWTEDELTHIFERCSHICALTVREPSEDARYGKGRLDRILLGKYTAYPVMLLFVALCLFITLFLASYPSRLLDRLFTMLNGALRGAMISAGAPELVYRALCDGILGTLFTVVAVMLPPMAIFFPLFSLLEEAGVLPRIAFNLDRPFACAGACGKQALTMCMGLGCNAVGVSGARIIDSKRERLLAVLTNSLVPCNGRLPILATLGTVSVLAASGRSLPLASALFVTAFVLLGVFITFPVTALLSKTVLKGTPSSFVLELPPYRMPDVAKVVYTSMKNKVLSVLCRAVTVAAPLGLLIFLLTYFTLGGTPLIKYVSDALDPIGKFMGLDGAILLAFILGLPASEIVVPILISIYSVKMQTIVDISAAEALVLAGFTPLKAICMATFCLLHFPCSTTLITVYKETRSMKYTLLCAALPTALGILICSALHIIFG